MKRIAVVFGLIFLLAFAFTIQTQTQAPTPPPELKALEVFNGEWAYEGEAMESPLGPAGKYSGKLSIRWILNGFFQEWKSVEKGVYGEIESIEFNWYDSTNKIYPFQGFQNAGDTWIGSWSVNANVWNWSNTTTHKGIQYKLKGLITIASDGISWTK